jgi:competence protein ComEA
VDKKIKIIWRSILGFFLIFAVLKFLLPVKTPLKIEQPQGNREIVIFITGAVENPGLLHLPLDARLDDALKEAVLSNDADLEVLNPAQKLKDGQKVIVPFRAEISESDPASGSRSMSTEISKEVGTSVKAIAGKEPRVNINIAGVGELDTIPGIGPALAQRIIDYREQNGPFSSPEEIQNVRPTRKWLDI